MSVREISLRAAASRLASDSVDYWRGEMIYSPPEDGLLVARHVLTEMDAMLADEEFFRSLGFADAWRDGVGFGLEIADASGKFANADFCRNDPIVFHAVGRETDYATESARVFNPTRGQVLTALRLFGIPVKRREK